MSKVNIIWSICRKQVARQKMRAKKLGVKSTLTIRQWANIIKYHNERCAYCHGKMELNPILEHMIPMSRGGANEASNVVVSCRDCNSKKASRTPLEFFMKHGAQIREASDAW